MLLALTALVAGVLGYGLFRVQQRARAVQTLEQAGAELSLRPPDWRFGRDPWWLAVPWTGVDRRVVSSASFVGPSVAQFGLLAHFPELQTITIQRSARCLDEEESAVIEKLPKVRAFGAFSASVSDSTINALANSPELRRILIYGCAVDGAVAEALGELPRAIHIELIHTGISAANADSLRQRLSGVRLQISPAPLPAP